MNLVVFLISWSNLEFFFFFQGFHKLNEFIITQHPTSETISDFWQMVWDHNCQTIVMLSFVDEKVSITYTYSVNIFYLYLFLYLGRKRADVLN